MHRAAAKLLLLPASGGLTLSEPRPHLCPAVARGHVGYTGVGVLLSCYGGYVAIVAVADVTKRMGVEWPDLARAFG